MLDQVRAILWAQWRVWRNYYPRNLGSLAFAVFMSLLWYGGVALGGVAAAFLLAVPDRAPIYERVVPGALLLVLLYWQIVPLMLFSSGASLDLKRLRVYPITNNKLFALEILLRVTAGAEMLLILTGAAAGILVNPTIHAWSILGLLLFVLMNLFLSAGLRDLLTRILARKVIREIAVLGFVLLMALPQFIAISGLPAPVRTLLSHLRLSWAPWTVTGRIAIGNSAPIDWFLLAAWTAAAWLFGRRQFERSLHFDADAARSSSAGPARDAGILEQLRRLPSLLFPDPLGAIVEKEIRFLTRAPRFRLVFMMGFSFGLLIWLPMAMRGMASGSTIATNFLTFVTLYALILLGEVTFTNTFGFDRSAAQIYFLMPVRFSTVLLGKNIAALLFVFLEVTAVAGVCMLLGLPIVPSKLLESYAVTSVMALYLIAIGNIGSVYYPRPVNPAQSWKSASAGRFQLLTLLIYPVISIPIALAYLARYAFESEAAFFAVLAFAAALGAILYWIAVDSAVARGETHKEDIIAALSRGEGPVST